jgi:hypothetical protein
MKKSPIDSELCDILVMNRLLTRPHCPMTDRPPSWKDRLHQSPNSPFIGRTVQLQAFRSTLATPWQQRMTLLFNISGQGGIGKTTLLKQFRQIVAELQQVAAYVDEGSKTNAIDNVPEALSRLALDFEPLTH